MGRPAKYSVDEILDAAADLVATGGPSLATMASIAERIDAPSGSLYHRFKSRDLLVAELWIRTVQESQQGFIEALAIDDLDEAAETACLHVPRWCRNHLAKAQVLILYRRQDLVERWPEELGDRLATLNTGLISALDDYTRRRYGRRSRRARRAVDFALLDIPYASVRPYLHVGEAPPSYVDELVRRACVCVLDTPP
jgi:AcrR family transcriptional regulator